MFEFRDSGRNQINLKTSMDSFFQNNAHMNMEGQKHFFKTLLRFTPFDEVEQIVKAYSDDKQSQNLWETYKSAKEEYLQLAPYFSRYSKVKDLSEIKETYQSKSSSELEDVCHKDLDYGKKRHELAKKLATETKDKKSFHPTRLDLLRLPTSSKNTRRAAAILEQVADLTYAEQKNPAFITLRNSRNRFSTPMQQIRYGFATPLAEAVLQHSMEPGLSKSITDRIKSYALTHQLMDGTKLTLNDVSVNTSWTHGCAPLNATWGAIEDVFEEILDMDLKNAKPETLTKFYDLTAELVWLIGNTQPLHRGSGSFAEMMLAIVHLHHGLQPPVLKLEFPQLDVLDITFPLSDYKFFFPYFFEPSTVPEHLRFNDIDTSDSLEMQMEQLYKKRNQLKAPQPEPTQIQQSQNTLVIKLQEHIDAISTACKQVDISLPGNSRMQYFLDNNNILNILRTIIRANGTVTKHNMECLDSLLKNYPPEYESIPGFNYLGRELTQVANAFSAAVAFVRDFLPLSTESKSYDRDTARLSSNSPAIFAKTGSSDTETKKTTLTLPEPESTILVFITNIEKIRDEVVAAMAQEEKALANNSQKDEKAIEKCKSYRNSFLKQCTEMINALSNMNKYRGYTINPSTRRLTDLGLTTLINDASSAIKPLILDFNKQIQEIFTYFEKLKPPLEPPRQLRP